jgi:hypothetical protein
VTKKKKETAPSGQTVMHSKERTPASPWKFRLFASESGASDLTKWDSKLSVAGRARRDAHMRFLCVQPPTRWSRPQASPLGDNVYVIRFKTRPGISTDCLAITTTSIMYSLFA